MTNEKAIYFLDKRKKELLEKQDSKEGFEFIKALAEIRSLEMAIKALETICIEDYPTCTECEHYDKEKHYCPRFCQVIKDTLAEAQPTDADCISRESIKQELQEHRNFYVNAYGGFSNLSQNDKSRVDEIDNCIAMVVNEPTVTPQRPKGKWIVISCEPTDIFKCSECGMRVINPYRYCPNCGSYNGGNDNGDE